MIGQHETGNADTMSAMHNVPGLAVEPGWTVERGSGTRSGDDGWLLHEAEVLGGHTSHRIDFDRRIETVSASYDDVFGFAPLPTFGGLQARVSPADRAGFDALLRAARSSFDPLVLRYRVVLPGGHVRWIEGRAKTQPDAEGRPARLLMVSRDFSRRMALLNRLERVQTAASIGAWEWDMRSNRATWSDAAWSLLEPGGSGDVTVERWLAAIHPDDREVALSQTQAAATSGNFQFEYRVVRPGNVIRWMQSMGSLEHDEAGQPTIMKGIVWDVTESKLSRQALLDADRRKDEFLATLAHELRNPLAPLRAVVDIMRQLENAHAALAPVRTMIEQPTMHLSRLIDDLLDVSRLASGKLKLEMSRVAVSEAIAAAIEMCQSDVSARGHVLEVKMPPTDVAVEADRFRLVQVLVNLIGNAAKYTPKGGCITIRAGQDGGSCWIAVEDNGIGIASEFLPRVFDAFAQADEVREQAAGGLGLGLMLVKQIVELHRGRVEAQSAGPGMGSRFEVRLPLPAAAIAKTVMPAPHPAASGPSCEGVRVLVVDDYAAIRDSMELMLTMRGFVVETAEGGQAALGKLASFEPDAVLLDLQMPGMSGFEVARAMRATARGAALKIIAMTGGGADQRQTSLDSGFDEHLIKPVAADRLAELLWACKRVRQPAA